MKISQQTTQSQLYSAPSIEVLGAGCCSPLAESVNAGGIDQFEKDEWGEV